MQKYKFGNYGGLLSFLFTLLCWAGISTVVISFDLMPRIWDSGSGYDTIAKNILNNGTYSSDGKTFTSFRPPSYPIFLAAIMGIFGDSWRTATIIFQIIFGALCAFFVFRIGGNVFESEFTPVASVIFFTLNPLFIGEALNIRETTLFSLIVLGFFYFVSKENIQLSDFIVAAIFAGLSYLTRPTGILLVVTFLFCIYVRNISDIKNVFVILTLLVLVISPWRYKVFIENGYLGLSSSTTGGLNMYKGNNPVYVNTYPWVDVDKQTGIIKENISLEGKTYSVSGNEMLKKKAIKYIVNNPVTFARGIIIKTVSLYSPIMVPVGNGKIVKEGGSYSINNFKAPNRPPVVLISSSLYTSFLIICFIGFISLYLANEIHSQDKLLSLIFTFMLLVTFLHAVTFAETRFRLPLDPFLCLFSGRYLSHLLGTYM